MIRKATVSGQFYPDNVESLKKMISQMIIPQRERKKAVAAISPHAGYIYSGGVAGEVFSSIVLPKTFIILGPNHTGIGSSLALFKEGEWETPLGSVPINKKLAELILKNCSLIKDDASAHAYEHSIEVQLPFLQYFVSSFSFVPICVSYLNYQQLEKTGIELAHSIKEFDEDVLLIASTDFSHYVSQKTAEKKDNMAIREILELNPKGLFEIVEKEKISMCGFSPTTIVLKAAIELGARNAELIKYATSGDISGNYSQVVGYGGIIIF
ncbi:AmmeMemoRadiSam system protein B [Candidatus Aminicenantes bacterium AH-873-B07]|jgi:hypothetical protein|nr:AmmeMemoRadiSam system protein B [Candidatus Aminicenantes bacterium AH-873-B07]